MKTVPRLLITLSQKNLPPQNKGLFMNAMKNILFSFAIMSTTFSYSIEPDAEFKKSTMCKEDANKMKNRLIATGALVGGATEFAAVWNYAKHSPSTSKTRLPLKVLISTVASVGGIWVGGCAAQEASDVIAQRLMRDDASELLTPHDKSEKKDAIQYAIELIDKKIREDNAKKTEEIVIEKS
jgi:hypothetical protein